MPRSSSTSSWTIFGIWKSIREMRVAKAIPSLLRVELDDERFLNRRVDFRALRPFEDLSGEPVVVGLQPRRDGRRQVGRVANHLLRGRPVGDGDHVVRLDLVARDVHAAAVDVEVAVPDELPGLGARRCEPESVDDVVEASLEHPEQVLTRDPGALGRLGVVRTELFLEQAVVAARFLLLAQLQQILGLLDPAAAVLARRIRATLDRAFLSQAALALEKELHALAAALLALRGTVSRHQTLRLLRGRTPLCACGVTSLTPRISSPAACSERIAVSRPEPGPLTKTSTFCSPCSMPLRAQASAVTWAANGVDLREPLKPAEPADSHAITFPSPSVRETIVLLKEVLMCAWPIAMFFFTRRRARPLVACRLGGAISGLGRCLLAAADGLLRALAGAGVGLRALAADGQAAPVPDSPVGADLAEALDRVRP